MYWRTIGILLVALCALGHAKVYIDVVNDGKDTTDTSCLGTELGGYMRKIKDMETKISAIQTRWKSQLAIQKRAMEDLQNSIEGRNRGNSTPTATSCDEALKGSDSKGGVFWISLPNGRIPPFEVYCLRDPNDGAAWMLIQRRQDGSVDFYRGWYDYKHGFGDVNGEFWLGLAKMHAITTSQRYELWMHLEDFEGQKRYAKYDSFAIGNENSNYALKILGKYTGDGGNSMNTHQGHGFTTKDSDNDQNENGNCARQYTGAWWYRSCHNSNLNGQYLYAKNAPEENGMGIEWFTWHGHYSLKHVFLAIRPIG